MKSLLLALFHAVVHEILHLSKVVISRLVEENYILMAGIQKGGRVKFFSYL
jgi:hypothetical protein